MRSSTRRTNVSRGWWGLVVWGVGCGCGVRAVGLFGLGTRLGLCTGALTRPRCAAPTAPHARAHRHRRHPPAAGGQGRRAGGRRAGDPPVSATTGCLRSGLLLLCSCFALALLRPAAADPGPHGRIPWPDPARPTHTPNPQRTTTGGCSTSRPSAPPTCASPWSRSWPTSSTAWRTARASGCSWGAWWRRSRSCGTRSWPPRSSSAVVQCGSAAAAVVIPCACGVDEGDRSS